MKNILYFLAFFAGLFGLRAQAVLTNGGNNSITHVLAPFSPVAFVNVYIARFDFILTPTETSTIQFGVRDVGYDSSVSFTVYQNGVATSMPVDISFAPPSSVPYFTYSGSFSFVLGSSQTAVLSVYASFVTPYTDNSAYGVMLDDISFTENGSLRTIGLGGYDWSTINVPASAVPEPGTWGIIVGLVAFGGAIVYRRKQIKA